ncbi:MAG: hypothetical protein FIA91_03480 [Geobacter sp.]|nr:hypothetical protein [Geobacter sp.]
MKRHWLPLLTLIICCTAGCTNFLYQGELAALDSYGKERHFVLYWTKTEPLMGEAKAGPAILLTECSPLTRIDFSERFDGIFFLGMPGDDRLPGQRRTTSWDMVCGKIANYARWVDVPAGQLSLSILCEPLHDEFDVEPRNYLAARQEAYSFPVVEKIKRWSFFGETLDGPLTPDCRGR